MFSKEFISKLKNIIIYTVVYTALFTILYFTSALTFPFILGFAIAFIIQPITGFFHGRLKMSKNIPSLLASIVVYLLIFTLTALLFYNIILEAKQLLVRLPKTNPELLLRPVKNILNEVGVYLRNIDPSFSETNSRQLSQLLSSNLNVVSKFLNTFLSITLSIPMWITIIFIIMLSTYFFSRDMTKIKKNILSIFSDSGRQKFNKVWSNSVYMLTKYIKAYSIIYALTFVETLIGFLILGVEYAVTLSIISAVADIIPVIGIAAVYVPVSLVYILMGDYITGGGIIILFILISIIRQVAEPKIVSDSLGMHPVASLVTIFIGLKAFGFTGMIYLTFLMVFYKVLKISKLV